MRRPLLKHPLAYAHMEMHMRVQPVTKVVDEGDCTTAPFKPIVIAAGDGAKAALSAFDHLMRLPAAAATESAPAKELAAA